MTSTNKIETLPPPMELLQSSPLKKLTMQSSMSLSSSFLHTSHNFSRQPGSYHRTQLPSTRCLPVPATGKPCPGLLAVFGKEKSASAIALFPSVPAQLTCHSPSGSQNDALSQTYWQTTFPMHALVRDLIQTQDHARVDWKEPLPSAWAYFHELPSLVQPITPQGGAQSLSPARTARAIADTVLVFMMSLVSIQAPLRRSKTQKASCTAQTNVGVDN